MRRDLPGSARRAESDTPIAFHASIVRRPRRPQRMQSELAAEVPRVRAQIVRPETLLAWFRQLASLVTLAPPCDAEL